MKTKIKPFFASVCIVALGLLNTGCGSKSEPIVTNVPESENLIFTPEGRLFITGGSNVFEVIKKQDGAYEKLDMFHQNCLVEGLIQRHNYIYAVCSKTNFSDFLDSYLLGAKLSDSAPTEIDLVEPGDHGGFKHPTMEIQEITTLDDLGVPNGMEVDEFGHVYIADSGTGTIFQIDFDSPTQVNRITPWAEKISPFVNGLEWIGDELYFTGFRTGTLKSILAKVQRNPDGSAGEVTILMERFATVLDDIAHFEGGIIVTDYVKGTLLFWRDGHVVYETESDTFFAPTAVLPGKAPMFDEDAFLVTEKGIIFNGNPRIGNQLGLFYPGLPLN